MLGSDVLGRSQGNGSGGNAFMSIASRMLHVECKLTRTPKMIMTRGALGFVSCDESRAVQRVLSTSLSLLRFPVSLAVLVAL
jgi:hypothetical protein